MKLAKLSNITWLNEGDEVPMATTHLVGQMEVLVPMAGLIDKDKEVARLNKEVEKLDKEIERIAKKLGNQGFVAKAPAAVIDKEKEKLAGFERDQIKLKEHIVAIKALQVLLFNNTLWLLCPAYCSFLIGYSALLSLLETGSERFSLPPQPPLQGYCLY